MIYNLIVLIGPNLEIGLNTEDGKFLLIWDKSEEAKEARASDLLMFKKVTVGSGKNVVIMGKNTWLSMIRKSDAFPILPDRFNIVVTSDQELLNKSNEQILFVDSFEKAIKAAEEKEESPTDGEIWIIGGLKIYKTFIDSNKHFKLKIHHQSDYVRKDCNVFFPEMIRNFNVKSFYEENPILKNRWFDFLID